ncbi:polysaccharide deacetylase family protein [Paenibacillus contaminans]|uniref:polysaccharide deacetylase family protein n=1 Tax=Paenibacillus contaminans TaxID=450362 RepID=UPI00131443A1|nr:polysaccharide deacetylase family protein [Paenibacillus contaminans]
MIRNGIRSLLLCAAVLTTVLTTLSMFKPEHLYRDQVAVLMYHHVHDEAQSSGTITTELFQEQLSYLKSQGYNFITLDDLKRFLKGATVPENAVLVTFDDGYESFYTNAFPILKKMDIPAVNFAITEDTLDPKSSYIPAMSREEIRDMTAQMSTIDVQCHTHALHEKIDGVAALTGRIKNSEGNTETEDQYKQRILEDTKMCLNTLTGLYPRPIDSLAYPFGIYNKTAAGIVHEAGVQYAFTILPRMTTRDTDPLKIPRINAGSPYITPEGLHNMIMRRVTSVNHPFDKVGLRDTLEQIGGELTVDKSDGNKVINYNGQEWKILPGGSAVLKDNVEIPLSKPLKVVGNRTFISLDDLQKVLGVQIVYNAETHTYTAKLPDESAIDAETKSDKQTSGKSGGK